MGCCPSPHKPDNLIQGQKLDAMYIVLLNDDFIAVHEEESLVVLKCRYHSINLEISHKNDIITEIKCSSKFNKNYIPLSVAQLQIFIMQARTGTQHVFFNN